MPEIWKRPVEKKLIRAIKEGKIIIYPTDTIYGIGCDATNEASVKKIREIKQRTDKPFSVIAPSKLWIYKNFQIKNKAYIQKLPGPFTYLLKSKKRILSKEVSKTNILGIRIPNNKVTQLIQKSGKPFITTSVNLSGEPHILKISQISEEMLNKVDIVIDQGILTNPPSTIIDLTKGIPLIIKR